MMTYSGKFVLTLAKGQYIGAESSSAENNKVILCLCNPTEVLKALRVILTSAELRTVADLIELVREATPLDEPERKESHEHQCCIRDEKTSNAIGFIKFQALPEEKGVCLKLSCLGREFMEDDIDCTVTMSYDEAGRVADAFHKMATALHLGRS